MTAPQVLDAYYMEHRAKLLDIAAYLDRLDRAQAGEAVADPRTIALREAIGLLIDGQDERVRRVLELLSDPTDEPIAKAGGKGAMGVWPGYMEGVVR